MDQIFVYQQWTISLETVVALIGVPVLLLRHRAEADRGLAPQVGLCFIAYGFSPHLQLSRLKMENHAEVGR